MSLRLSRFSHDWLLRQTTTSAVIKASPRLSLQSRVVDSDCIVWAAQKVTPIVSIGSLRLLPAIDLCSPSPHRLHAEVRTQKSSVLTTYCGLLRFCSCRLLWLQPLPWTFSPARERSLVTSVSYARNNVEALKGDSAGSIHFWIFGPSTRPSTSASTATPATAAASAAAVAASAAAVAASAAAVAAGAASAAAVAAGTAAVAAAAAVAASTSLLLSLVLRLLSSSITFAARLREPRRYKGVIRYGRSLVAFSGGPYRRLIDVRPTRFVPFSEALSSSDLLVHRRLWTSMASRAENSAASGWSDISSSNKRPRTGRENGFAHEAEFQAADFACREYDRVTKVCWYRSLKALHNKLTRSLLSSIIPWKGDFPRRTRASNAARSCRTSGIGINEQKWPQLTTPHSIHLCCRATPSTRPCQRDALKRNFARRVHSALRRLEGPRRLKLTKNPSLFRQLFRRSGLISEGTKHHRAYRPPRDKAESCSSATSQRVSTATTLRRETALVPSDSHRQHRMAALIDKTPPYRATRYARTAATLPQEVRGQQRDAARLLPLLASSPRLWKKDVLCKSSGERTLRSSVILTVALTSARRRKRLDDSELAQWRFRSRLRRSAEQKRNTDRRCRVRITAAMFELAFDKQLLEVRCVLRDEVPDQLLLEFLEERCSRYGNRTWLVDALNGREVGYTEFIEMAKALADTLQVAGLRSGDMVAFRPTNSIRSMAGLLALLFMQCPVVAVQTVAKLDDLRELLKHEPVTGALAMGTLVNDLREIGKSHETLKIVVDLTDDAYWTGKADDFLVAIRHRQVQAELFRGDDASVCASVGHVHLPVIARESLEGFINILCKYRLRHVLLFAALCAAIARNAAAFRHKLTAIEQIGTAGSVVDTGVVRKLFEGLPNLKYLHNTFGTSESCVIGAAEFVRGASLEDIEYLTIGPNCVARIEDIVTRKGFFDILAEPDLDALRGHRVRSSQSGHGVNVEMTLVVNKRSFRSDVLPPGESGELVVKSPALALGYCNNEAATRSTFVDGWFRTGDIGVIDERGRIKIVDRLKEMIKCYDCSVSPSQIEKYLRHCLQECADPAFREVAEARKLQMASRRGRPPTSSRRWNSREDNSLEQLRHLLYFRASQPARAASSLEVHYEGHEDLQSSMSPIRRVVSTKYSFGPSRSDKTGRIVTGELFARWNLMTTMTLSGRSMSSADSANGSKIATVEVTEVACWAYCFVVLLLPLSCLFSQPPRLPVRIVKKRFQHMKLMNARWLSSSNILPPAYMDNLRERSHHHIAEHDVYRRNRLRLSGKMTQLRVVW
ncbi:4-coumarate--CoA ligase 7-like [Tropilaelaps mercedesae]|uniref:4-coumarate--CoA ligase 7-like n=1 Tax=Tropilaelaps mercedesae TaxID=418985 RepID=A0A1V9XCE4_9ACAR|nr:4-coumarate--CoA ligase 7-like [Tropilaelaps mercedesae]